MCVRSFDLFDTLIGRIRYHPDSVFYLVQERFPFPGFVFFRTVAEYQSDRTLSGIYRRFRELTGISEKKALALKEFEFQIELSQLFPIIENFHLVQDGHLIVSDTYYDADRVKQVLAQVGLTKQVHIYATPQGKSLGLIWDVIKKKNPNIFHIGDSFHSDVIMPKNHGIHTFHYTKSQFSFHEQKIVDLGKEELAFLMRALRLQNPYSIQTPEHLLWNDQCQINIPILIEASLYLDAFCKAKKLKKILFTSRDGCLWIQLFQKLFPEYESLPFYSSRYVYLFPTSSFIEYVQNVYKDNSVIVDSHGSGRSCTTFFRKYLKIRPIYLSIVNPKKGQHAILRTNRIHETIEKLNYDLVGSLYDVQYGQPLRGKIEYDPRFVEPSHQCVKKCLDLLSHYDFRPFNRQVIQHALRAARKKLAIDTLIEHAIYHIHLNDGKRMRHIHVFQRDGEVKGISQDSPWVLQTNDKQTGKKRCFAVVDEKGGSL